METGSIVAELYEDARQRLAKCKFVSDTAKLDRRAARSIMQMREFVFRSFVGRTKKGLLRLRSIRRRCSSLVFHSSLPCVCFYKSTFNSEPRVASFRCRGFSPFRVRPFLTLPSTIGRFGATNRVVGQRYVSYEQSPIRRIRVYTARPTFLTFLTFLTFISFATLSCPRV